MKNKKAYIATIETKEQLKFAKSLLRLESLTSKESQFVYYKSRYGDNFKLNENIVVVPLKKVNKGYIIYITNSIYWVGRFIYVTNKEYDKFVGFNFKIVSDVNIYQWRYLYYFESVVNEFKHPLYEIEKELLDRERAIKHNQYILEVYSDKRLKLLARF